VGAIASAEGEELNLFGLLTGPADLIDLDAHVCTDAPQIPIAPGNLISETSKDGRICRTYKTDQPISNFFSMLSGDYAITEDSWDAPDGRKIPIRIYHAEQHDYSVDSMITATQYSLGHFTEHFSPYQYDYVRILEVPFIGFAQAYAGTIPFAFDSDGPSLTETPDGQWRVTFNLKTDKDIKTEEMETSESWSEIEGEVLNEPLEIGVYTDEPKKLWSAWTKLERIQVTEAEQAVSIIVDEKPTHIAIDPRRLMLERNIDDNVQTISESSAFAR